MRTIVAAFALVAVACLGIDAQEPAKVAHVTTTPFARDGTGVDAYLPAELHIRNVGGSDGAGLCVFSAIEMVARTLNIPELFGFRAWMEKKPGGGWPEKVNATITQFCRETGKEPPTYFHVQANDPDILRQALRSGRAVGITYSYSPTGRYGGARIAHMVYLAAAGTGNGPDGKGWYAIQDNNFPGSWEWMSEAQFLSVASGGGRLWACIFAAPTYPPAPTN